MWDGQEWVYQSWVQGPSQHPVHDYVPTMPGSSLRAQKWACPSGPGQGKTAQGVVPHRGLLIASSRFMWPDTWPGPQVGMKSMEHSSVPQAGGHQVSIRVAQAAVLSASAGAFFFFFGLISSPRAGVA